MKPCHRVPFGRTPRGCPVWWILPGSTMANLKLVAGWYRAFPA